MHRMSAATEVAEPPAPPGRPPTWRRTLPLMVLLVGSVVARLPELVNARGVDSDAAVVGLQAMHLLRGEWSWFLWGAGYQASFDAVLVAAAFAVTGPSALTLMAVPLVGHLVLVGLTHDVVRRAIGAPAGRWSAAVACLPLVFSPQSINGVALAAPRQWSITAAILAVWLASRAADPAPARPPRGPREATAPRRIHRCRGPAWLAGSGLVAGFAVYLDLFTLQLMPAVGVFALWCAVAPRRATAEEERGRPAPPAGTPPGPGLPAAQPQPTVAPWRAAWRTAERGRSPGAAVDASGAVDGGRAAPSVLERVARVGALLLGAAAGVAVIAWSRAQPVADGAKAGLTLDRLAANWTLLTELCLPYLLGVTVFVPDPVDLVHDPWPAPGWWQVVQWAGAVGFGAAAVWAVIAVLVHGGWSPRRVHHVQGALVPPPVRRLGALGLIGSAASVGGFLVSTMPADLLSARYLAPIVWLAPFTLAPAAYTLGTRAFTVAIAPFVLAVGVGGWIAFAPHVAGPLPVRDPRGVAVDEAALADALRAEGVRYATAQYWLAYRLTFLFTEDPVVVPLDEREDRYRPYRDGFAAAPVVAYVFHPSEPRATPGPVEDQLRGAGTPYRRADVNGFAVLIVRR